MGMTMNNEQLTERAPELSNLKRNNKLNYISNPEELTKEEEKKVPKLIIPL